MQVGLAAVEALVPPRRPGPGRMFWNMAAKSDIEARLSPGIRSLDMIDRMDVFRRVVELADFKSEDLQTIEVGGHRVCWRVVGSVIAIGFAAEFSAPRKSDNV